MGEEIIYQYRNLDVFQKIIEKKELWLTSAYHQNDKQEINFLLNHIVEKIKERASSETRIDSLDKLIDYFINSDIFISCFSKEKDILSQWRTYGDNGKGVSLGFEFDLEYSSLFVSEVEYKEYTQLEDIMENKEIKSSIEKIYIKIFNKCVHSQKEYKYLLDILKLASKIKHNGFSEEKESRLIFIASGIKSLEYGSDIVKIVNNAYTNDINNYRSYRWEDNSQDKSNSTTKYEEIGDFKYYTTKNDLIPYFEFKYPETSLREIILGPCCTIKESDLKSFLNVNGFDIENITISRSQIPYRAIL